MKTNDFVVSSRPYVWVINETKSSSLVASRVSVPSYYNMYETPALRCSARSSKWGVIAAVRNDLHSQRVPIPDGLVGRVIALDVIIPTTSACTRVLYAPWDPGGPQPTPSQFWPMVAQLCRDAPSKSWCIIGDCNLTLASVEAANPSPPNPNRVPYLSFLRDARGHDLWSAQDERFAFSHYTYSRGPVRSILDRVAYSHANILDGSIDIPYVLPRSCFRIPPLAMHTSCNCRSLAPRATAPLTRIHKNDCPTSLIWLTPWWRIPPV